MTRIESRPSKGYNQNYSFYIDFDGKRGDAAVDDLMDDLKKNSLVLMVLHDKKGMCACICTATCVHERYHHSEMAC